MDRLYHRWKQIQIPGRSTIRQIWTPDFSGIQMHALSIKYLPVLSLFESGAGFELVLTSSVPCWLTSESGLDRFIHDSFSIAFFRGLGLDLRGLGLDLRELGLGSFALACDVIFFIHLRSNVEKVRKRERRERRERRKREERVCTYSSRFFAFLCASVVAMRKRKLDGLDKLVRNN